MARETARQTGCGRGGGGRGCGCGRGADQGPRLPCATTVVQSFTSERSTATYSSMYTLGIDVVFDSAYARPSFTILIENTSLHCLLRDLGRDWMVEVDSFSVKERPYIGEI